MVRPSSLVSGASERRSDDPYPSSSRLAYLFLVILVLVVDQHPRLQAPTLDRSSSLLGLRGFQGHAREGVDQGELDLPFHPRSFPAAHLLLPASVTRFTFLYT
jgi:hypothetical protein